MRVCSLTAWILLLAIPGSLPRTFNFTVAVSSSHARCAAARKEFLRETPTASVIIDCESREFKMPGRDA